MRVGGAGVDVRSGGECAFRGGCVRGSVSGNECGGGCVPAEMRGELFGGEVSGGGADVCVGGGERRLLFTGVDARRNVLSGGALP